MPTTRASRSGRTAARPRTALASKSCALNKDSEPAFQDANEILSLRTWDEAPWDEQDALWDYAPENAPTLASLFRARFAAAAAADINVATELDTIRAERDRLRHLVERVHFIFSTLQPGAAPALPDAQFVLVWNDVFRLLEEAMSCADYERWRARRKAKARRA